MFATGTSASCTSIFKPLWVDTPLTDPGLASTSTYDPTSLFWSHERLHRAVLLNFPERIAAYAADRDILEKQFVQGALALIDAPRKERAEFSAECFRQAALAEAEWWNACKKYQKQSKSVDYWMALPGRSSTGQQKFQRNQKI